MQGGVDLVEVVRGDRVESLHQGAAVIVDAGGTVRDSWGDAEAVIYPRSSAKMIQALPLVESGAADAHGLTSAQLALACASHHGRASHTDAVAAWLTAIGQAEPDLRCGTHLPVHTPTRRRMIRREEEACQIHHQCSGKHTGFLTLNRHLKGGPEYLEIDHPAQIAIKAAFEETTAEDSPGWGIDGCSAPNHACTLTGLARAAAAFAGARPGQGARADAMIALREAMMAHPDHIDAEGQPDSLLMRAAGGRAAVKGGAEAVHLAILPELGLGVALKIADGSSRAKAPVMAALLVRLGVLSAEDPTVAQIMRPRQTNSRGIDVGELRPVSALLG